MYAIEEGLQKVNGEYVETFEREVTCGNTELGVVAGTTGYKGGCCRNAGGRTYLSLLWAYLPESPVPVRGFFLRTDQG